MNSQSETKTSSEIIEKKINIIKFENPLELKIKEFTIKNIIDSYEKGISLKDILIRVSPDKNILEINDLDLNFLGIIFKEPIKVVYEKAIIDGIYYTLIDEQVYSNKQISSSLEKYNVVSPIIIDNENRPTNYYESLYSLFWNIRKKEINIINSFKECKLKENKVILLNKINFNKVDLSKYFDEYFIYPQDKTEFIYYPTPNRKILEENCSLLINNKKITQFKITGPSGEGKSISLLYYSRCSFNKIYLNLKTIYNLYSPLTIEKYLDLLIYEFGRLNFKDTTKKASFEKAFNKYSINNFWELLEQLSQILKGQKIVFILDQFKDKYVDKKYFAKIKENLKENLKIIISSSINDHEIGNQAANSLIKHKDENFKLTEDNQNDYFYCSDLVYINDLKRLFDIKDEKKIKLYDYFSWNPKYIYLIDKKEKSKDDLQDQIITKMKEHSSNLGIDFELYIFNIYLRINRETNYDILPLKTLSLKYCKLQLGKESFKVSYKYPIIKIIIDELIKDIDVKKYFNNKNYEDNELYSNLKGYFFEYAAIKQINLIKDQLFEEPIEYSLTVENIINIKQYEEKNKKDYNADTFKMLIEELNNTNTSRQEITRKDLLEDNLKLVNEELTIREKEKNNNGNIDIEGQINDVIEDSEEQSDDENSEEKEGSEEKENNMSNYEEEDDENLQIKNENMNEKKKDINYYFYKNLKKEKNKIVKLLGNKTKRTEIKNKEVYSNKKEKKIDKTINLNMKVECNKYNENFKNGAIMIIQKQINGETLDLGFLLGKKDNKKLIGFQMKFYSKNSKLKNKITKDSIKRSIQPILVNCFKNFGIKINEWHYIMCLYYNTEDEYQFSSKLVNNCNNNDLEYIFFNPKKNKFYKSDKSDLDKIKLNFKSNIDFYSKVNPYLIFKDTGFLKEYLNQAHEDSILVSENDYIFNMTYDLTLKNISEVIKMNAEIVCKFELDKESHFPIPKNSILLLFSDNKNFIYYYNINNQLNCKLYQISSNDKITRNYSYCCPSLIPRYLNLDKRFKKSDKIYFYTFKIIDLKN